MLLKLVSEKDIKDNLNFGEDQNSISIGRRGRQTIDLTNEIDSITYPKNDYKFENVLKETASQVLSREFAVKYNITYTTTEFRPLKALFDFSPVLRNYVSSMKFLRCSLKLRFVQNTTPQQYGVMAISWLPNVIDNEALFPHQIINADPVLMDLSTRETVEINIPYVNLQEFYRLGDTSMVTQSPVVYMTMFGPYVLDSSIVSPTYSIYISMYEITTCGATAQMGDSTGWEIATGLGRLAYENYGSQAMNSASSIGLKMLSESYNRYKGNLYAVDESSQESENPLSTRNQAFGDVAGCVFSPTLKLTSHIPTFISPNHLGDVKVRHRIKDIIRTPTICDPITFNTNDSLTSGLALKLWPQIGNYTYSSYMDEMANLFRYCRGSIKLKLMFYTSPLISCTFRLVHYNTDADGVSADDAVIKPNGYTKLISVRGSTEVNIVFPFLASKPWSNLDRTNSGVITSSPMTAKLFLETPPANVGDQTARVIVIPIICAGDDFQFKDLRSVTPDYLDEGLAFAQMHVRSSMNCQFDNIAGGSASSSYYRPAYEDDMTIEDVCARYSTRLDTKWVSSSFHDYQLNTNETSLKSIDNFDYLFSLFRYVRGGIRIKVQATAALPYPFVYMESGSISNVLTYSARHAAGNGLASNTSAQNGILEFEVPFMSDCDWIYTNYLGYNYCTNNTTFQGYTPFITEPQAITTGASSVPFLVAAGRDFQFAFLMPPKANINFPVNAV